MSFSALRLAVGTLTVVPVGDLPEITPRIAGRAVVAAPLAVLPLSLATAAVGWLAYAVGLPSLVVGLLMVAVLALGTRGLHLDGLADTADGLGSGWSIERALEIMKRGNIGPLGVVTLVLVLGLQAAALGVLVDGTTGAVTAGIAVCASRAGLVLVCARGVPAARPDGLGVVVAGTVTRGLAALSWIVVLAGLSATFEWRAGRWWLGLVAGTVAGLVVLGLVRHCVRRFGGVTGDVMGAAIELAFSTLVVCAVLR
jgi:adenosylcobinamide-GDP ribazoletransferase